MTCVMSVNLMMQGEKSNDAIFSKSVLFSKAHELRGSGLSDPRGREAIALLDFGRSVKLSLSGGQIMPHHITTCPSGSSDLPTNLEGVKMASLCETSQNCVVTVH